MREIALYDAKNSLSALIAEVEATGEDIVITRHGTPAARLAPIERRVTAEERAQKLSRLATRRDAWAAAHPDAAKAVAWEQVKTWMDEDR
jgi:prevent-host-death family protein